MGKSFCLKLFCFKVRDLLAVFAWEERGAMSYAMSVEAVRECSGFTEKQCERVLLAAGDDLEAALAMVYDDTNKLIMEIRAEGLPPTSVPSFVSGSWQDDHATTDGQEKTIAQ